MLSITIDDLLVHILSYLTIEDLAEVAPTCRALRNVCRHEALPQLRSVTIRCVSGSTDNVIRSILCAGKRGLFRKLRRLHIEGVDRLSEVEDLGLLTYAPESRMPLGVEQLDLSPGTCTSQSIIINPGVLELLQSFLPDAEDLNLSHCLPSPVALMNCRGLRTLRWTNQNMSLPLTGIKLPASPDLQVLILDDSIFHVHRHSSLALMCLEEDDQPQTNHQIQAHSNATFMFQRFGSQIKRVSIKNGRYALSSLLLDDPSAAGIRQLPQSALIKFVRNSPTLERFRSDLTRENVVMLQKERPAIVFE